MKKENYRGHLITYTAGFYWALTIPFKSLKAAKRYIDDNTPCAESETQET